MSEEVRQTNEVSKHKREDKNAYKQKWRDEDVLELIELFEERTCLWDIHSNEYAERTKKEKAYLEIAEHFQTTSANVKRKLNTLRAQLGREFSKEVQEGTSKRYDSKWIFYGPLQFLRPVMTAASKKSRDIICPVVEKDIDNSTILPISEPPLKKKRILAKSTVKLVSRCSSTNQQKTTALVEKGASMPRFALLIEEKLSKLNRRNRTIAEKRIMDVVFEIEMSSLVNETGDEGPSTVVWVPYANN